ncbi:general amino acid permease agp2 [Paecilomyces lecythidis]|uniref:General amino acid permease agp2 n=1 Tax=Paecilomyces lecythidis TaxID=3004212 RepID=A0ABR3X8C6_9EURO
MAASISDGGYPTVVPDPESGSLASKRRVKGPTDGEKAKIFEDNADSVLNVSIQEGTDHTHRRLKPRHIQLIGIGGTIGTALYVQIGQGLMHGGPASLFIAFAFW